MSKRPHLVFIFADQLHHQAWGRRDSFFSSPNLDQLARSVDCTRTYCTTPLCSPSRSSLLRANTRCIRGSKKMGSICKYPPLPAATKAGIQNRLFWQMAFRRCARSYGWWDEAQGVCNEYKAPNRPLGDDETLAFAQDFIARHADSDEPIALFVSFDEPHGHYVYNPHSGYPADHPVPEKANPNTPLRRPGAKVRHWQSWPWDMMAKEKVCRMYAAATNAKIIKSIEKYMPIASTHLITALARYSIHYATPAGTMRA